MEKLTESDKPLVLGFVQNGVDNSSMEEIEAFIKYEKIGLRLAKEELSGKPKMKLIACLVIGVIIGVVIGYYRMGK